MESIRIRTRTKKRLDWLREWMRSKDGREHDYDDAIDYLTQMHWKYNVMQLR